MSELKLIKQKREKYRKSKKLKVESLKIPKKKKKDKIFLLADNETRHKRDQTTMIPFL